jgi:hypothetical protein
MNSRQKYEVARNFAESCLIGTLAAYVEGYDDSLKKMFWGLGKYLPNIFREPAELAYRDVLKRRLESGELPFGDCLSFKEWKKFEKLGPIY